MVVVCRLDLDSERVLRGKNSPTSRLSNKSINLLKLTHTHTHKLSYRRLWGGSTSGSARLPQLACPNQQYRSNAISFNSTKYKRIKCPNKQTHHLEGLRRTGRGGFLSRTKCEATKRKAESNKQCAQSTRGHTCEAIVLTNSAIRQRVLFPPAIPHHLYRFPSPTNT